MGSLINNVLFMPPLGRKEENEEELEKIENLIFKDTAHGSRIGIITHIKNPNYLYLLVSHGNAETIFVVNQSVKNYLAKLVNVNIVMYEYTGYSEETQNFTCSEQFCYNDAETAYNYIVYDLKVPPERIVLFGRSLGSGPSCYLAEKYAVGGLFLNSGFMSVYRVAFKFRWTLPGDKFPNIDRIKNIKCPVCIVHSVKDEIIPFYHAREMYRKSVNKFPPLYIDGTTHNNIDKNCDHVYQHMQKFFKHIDPNYVTKDINDFYANKD